MNKLFFSLICYLFISTYGFSQSVETNNVGINTTTPHASAALDVVSTTQGVLVPRMTASQRGLISSPATGLLVYQSDATAGFYFYNGTAWTQLGATGPQGIQGATGPQGIQGAAGAQGAVGLGYGGTSSSAKTISLGSKTFVVQAGLAYIPGERIRFVDQTNSANFLEGTITSYTSTSMVVNIDNNGGTGTVSNWNLSVGGNLGTTGVAGANGVGVPSGGTTGQVLAKVDGTNFNTQWVTPAIGGASTYPNVELSVINTTIQNIPDLLGGTTTSVLIFSTSNSPNASLTGGNTWDGSVFTVGSNGAGWYQVNAQTVGVTSGGAVDNRGVLFFLDKNNTVGTSKVGAINRSNNSFNTSENILKNTNTMNILIYLSVGDNLRFRAYSQSNSTTANTSADGSTFVNIMRVK